MDASTGLNRPVCSHCGGSNLELEATVHWAPGKGAEVGQICDKGHYCVDCDGETSLRWVPDVPAPDGAPGTQLGAPADEPRWTILVVERERDHKTTFFTRSHAEDVELAKREALEEAAEAWGEDASALRVLGVASGSMNIAEWDDGN